MFEQLKQIKKLKQMQDTFGKERFEIEERGTRVVINGSLKVEEIFLAFRFLISQISANQF